MEERIVDQEITLIPYFPNEKVTLAWYQNLHIGRRCIANMIRLAKENGMRAVKANIYALNVQSQRSFQADGFRQVSDEWFEYRIEE